MKLLSKLLLCLLAAATSAQRPSTEGFITIDCGLDSEFPYTDPYTGITYSPDKPYTTAGVNEFVAPEANVSNLLSFFMNVRSFPNGTRNCYTLRPVKIGGKYRVKGEFIYGNYDGRNRPPTFDLYLGVNLWTTVEPKYYEVKEIIFIAMAESVDVCLVNTGRGTPFISELDLRPLPSSMYTQVNSGQSLVTGSRWDYGGKYHTAYPDDAYDRRWYPYSSRKIINTNSTVAQPISDKEFPVPSNVLQTAEAAFSPTDNLIFTINGNIQQKSFVYIYVAELERLSSNDTREFDIYVGNDIILHNFRPSYLQAQVIYSKGRGVSGGSTFYFRPTAKSTLPPIINALEDFTVQEVVLQPTDQIEVNAMSKLKSSYGVRKNWQGDPCQPKNYIWEGIKCTMNATNHSSISSLDLSWSGLIGGIPPTIANLTTLTSLDLSHNNLTGEIPSYMGQLPLLKFLNLEANNLNGTLPENLNEKLQDGSIELRIGNNPILCSNVKFCSNPSPKKRKIVIPIAIAVSIAVLLLGLLATTYVVRRLKTGKKQNTTDEEPHAAEPGRPNASPRLQSGIRYDNQSEYGLGFAPDSHQFSSSDIADITDNFKRPIRRGGFGAVYHGYLNDGTEVAVKVLSVSSTHAVNQFSTEAQLLTRVHHKYLVSLLGYCNENLALVFEYVRLGSLSDHLSGDTPVGNILTWSRRVRIALEAAQGLDYLHNACQPPIIHRDMKTSNILLTENFEVKLSGFGLSRSFDDDITHISTAVAGTLGYIDPKYYHTNRLNEKSDVYSFGVVLLELVTGNPPISNDIRRTHITKQVTALVERGNIGMIVDRRMHGQYDTESMWKVIEIALSCTSLSTDQRPNITDVVLHLKESQSLQNLREFHSDTISDSLSIIPQYSIEDITPSPR